MGRSQPLVRPTIPPDHLLMPHGFQSSAHCSCISRTEHTGQSGRRIAGLEANWSLQKRRRRSLLDPATSSRPRSAICTNAAAWSTLLRSTSGSHDSAIADRREIAALRISIELAGHLHARAIPAAE